MRKFLERLEVRRVENLMAPNGMERFAQEEKQNIMAEYKNILEINKEIHREMRKFLERLEMWRLENLMAPNRMDRFVQEEKQNTTAEYKRFRDQ